MLHLLLVAVGGAIGAGIRHLFNLGALRLVGPNFPWGTMVINIIGSFVMGAFIATLSRRYGGASSELRLFVATGILGGFTTFSSFSLDAALLWERHETLLASGYVIGSVVVSIIGLFAGMYLVRQLT